jgi:hypothetical protein
MLENDKWGMHDCMIAVVPMHRFPKAGLAGPHPAECGFMTTGSRRSAQPGNTRSGKLSGLSIIAGPDPACDCPACQEEEVSPEQMLTSLVDGAASLAEAEDPLEAELTGASFVALACAQGDHALEAFAEGIIPGIEALGTRAALTLLTAVAAAAHEVIPSVAEPAREATARLTKAGIQPPAWAEELTQPLEETSFTRLSEDSGGLSILVGTWQRAGREHGLMITIDHEHCGAAEDILLFDAAEKSSILALVRQGAQEDGVSLRSKELGAPEFRWYAEEALQARAVHDEEDDASSVMEAVFDEDEEGPGYAPLALLTRQRLTGLPPASRPRGATVSDHLSSRPAIDVLGEFAALFDGAGLGQLPGRVRSQPAKLPPKRKKSDGAAPVFQIKVNLRGAKPPIWRRLLVPGDITLNHLHETILTAFEWEGHHLHAFETDYGQFGEADRELGHRSDRPVTLEQIAPAVKDKFTYVYDFGDDWEHQILVEKIAPADPSMTYPACTGGRRAAPPDDCGGIWGYQDLIEVLADPAAPGHAERLEWLGLDDAGEFSPATFDPEQVNARLRSR